MVGKTVSESCDEYRFNESANNLYDFLSGMSSATGIWRWRRMTLYQSEGPPQTADNPAGYAACAQELSGAAAPDYAFVTEEIGGKLPVRERALLGRRFPEFNAGQVDAAAEAEIAMLIEVVSAMRICAAK